MAYEVPDVTVEQDFTTTSPVLNAPDLPLCIIGVCNQLVAQGNAGSYSRGTPATIPYPELIQGAVVNQATVRTFLQNSLGLFEITNLVTAGSSTVSIPGDVDLTVQLNDNNSVTGASNGIIFSDPNVDFLDLGVTSGGSSKLLVTSPAGNVATYIIDQLIDPNTLRVHEEVSGALATGSFGGTFTGSVIAEDDIGVIAHVTTVTNLDNDYATGSQSITQAGIGTNVQVGDYLRVTHSAPVMPTPWQGLSIASLTKNQGSSGNGRIVLSASAPVGIIAGDKITIVGATDSGNDGTYTIIAVSGANVDVSGLLGGANQGSAAGTANVQDVNAGGDGDPAAAGDYLITAVLNANTIQIASPGLLGKVDGTDYVLINASISSILASDVGGGHPTQAKIILSTAIPGSIVAGDFIIISNATNPANDGTYTIAASPALSGSTLWLTKTLTTSETSGPSLATLQDVNSTTVDTFKVDRVARGANTFLNTAGDYLVVTSGAAVGNYQVASATPDLLTLLTPLLGATANSDTYSYLRGLPFNSISNSYQIQQTNSGPYSATVLITYQALRQDLTGVLTQIDSITDVTTLLGFPVPQNPLALAASVALNTTVNSIFVIGLNADSVVEHQNALEFLESEEVYTLVPLTQDLTNLSLYPAHVTALSTPVEKKERICLLNRQLFIQSQEWPENNSTSYPVDGATDVTGLIFTSASAQFQTVGVSQGDDLVYLDSGNHVLATYRVASVTNQTTLVLLSAAPASASAVKFLVQTHALSKDAQAAYIATYAESILNRRAVLVWPDQISLTYADLFSPGTGANVTATVPGYYLSCAIGGMINQQDPQQPFTNLPIQGITQLFDSNRYFRGSQLDVMAAGGVYICVQATVDSLPYTRHQLTTDPTTIESQELSIVKDVDYIAKYFRNNLRPYIGRFNITGNYLSQVRTAAQSIIKNLLAAGQCVSGTTIASLIQDPTTPDQVILDVNVKVPFPANYIRVTLLI
jgi:hypothetical protein